MDKNKFGSYIKEARIKKNYTQQELADLLFVDASTVSKWERGVSYPDITLVPDICKVLEISEHELIQSSHDFEYRKMKKDAKKYNNIKGGIFWTFNISYIIAILTCFIVNLAVSHTLSWFFIVLSSIICAYTICPTITWISNKYKKSIFIISSFIGMFLLFLTCSIYGDNYWFMIATFGVLLGYFILFYPILFREQKKYLNEEKYNSLSKWFLLSYVLGMIIVISLLLLSIYIYKPFNLGLGLLILGGIGIIPILFGILNLFEVTRNYNKISLISLACIFIVLICVSLVRAIYIKNNTTTETYNIEETYTDIKIKAATFDVNIYLSDDENKVVYVENSKVTVDNEIIDNTLIVTLKDSRKWYDKMFDFTRLKVDLYLSEEIIDKLDIETSTGNINVDEGFTFESVDIDNSTGDIRFKSNVVNNLKINNSTGDIIVEKSNIGGNVDIETSTGNTKLIDVLVTGNFNMEGSTGDLVFDSFDANNIYVTLSTGDVEGTILSSKIFNAKSDTGKVEVPETYGGGICKITVSTGDINISYK